MPGSRESDDQGLMKSLVENDENVVRDGRLLAQATHQGFSSFVPDMLFDQLTKDYATSANLYGEKFLRLLSGYEPSYIERNIKIPEFRRELRSRMQDRVAELRDRGFLDRDGIVTNLGFKLGGLLLYVEELEKLMPSGMIGERSQKKLAHYGERYDTKGFRSGDRFKDLAVSASTKVALRRGHSTFSKEDLRMWERRKKGSVVVMYVLDASGSMRGRKIEMAKKAGIGLAFAAIGNKDLVGLVVFGKEIIEEVPPTQDFKKILYTIARVRPSKETDMVKGLRRCLDLFPDKKMTKHIVVLSDALPNIGIDPERETEQIVSLARSRGITFSMVGIGLNEKGAAFATRLAGIGSGRVYVTRDSEDLDAIILEDYQLAR